MTPGIIKIIFKSIIFYRKQVIYQFLIIALLSAVITGSLLTGHSVKTSLKKSAEGRLGNTGILISSGLRYFDPALVSRMKEKSGIKCTGLLEINGTSQNLTTQKEAFNTRIFALNEDFFRFQGNSLNIKKGEVIINRRLADQLQLTTGEEIVLRFSEISDIPADAPFAPSTEESKSVVMKIGGIAESSANGDFSLLISQIVPMNVFIHVSDLENSIGKQVDYNRLLIEKNTPRTPGEIKDILKNDLIISDIGLRVRNIKRTRSAELISERIFIDEAILNEIRKKIPSGEPVITYLANRMETDSRSNPYSFVSALPGEIYNDIPDDGIIINEWLADDLNARTGDSIKLFWYSPDSLDKLTERNKYFIIKDITGMNGVWGDSLLMPEFPGIAGSESCSDWNAGVPIKMSSIRDIDEDYWNKFRGTPKAFLNYKTGKEIWGSNFGPATAIRFPESVTTESIEKSLNGSLDPELTGFIITDLYSDSIKAAEESVDFGTLFLSLGFFLILASIVLLSFATSYYFDSKRGQIKTLYALGFRNKIIEKLLFSESFIIGFSGCLTGAISGMFVNFLITESLNSVWRGAVQTDTLKSYFDIVSVITGFAATLIIVVLFMYLRTRKYLKSLNRNEAEPVTVSSGKINFVLLVISAIFTASVFIFSVLNEENAIASAFGSGIMLMLTLILFWRYYYISGKKDTLLKMSRRNGLSDLYYSFYPSHAITPILFIAAGIFAFFITSINRKDFNADHLNRRSGTGGYLLWCESNIPVSADLNSSMGRKSFGLDEDTLSSLRFVAMKRSGGNDASCLNLNHIVAPPLLGVDPSDFIDADAFSFAKVLSEKEVSPWNFLTLEPGVNTIYGIADQTVLDWGLKISVGDTLILRSENGQPLNIIIAAGLQPSVFQGHIIIGMEHITRYFPSVSGSSVLLAGGDAALVDLYKSILEDRLSNHGMNIEKTTDRLTSFYEVTNTYLSVFGVFGGLGMIIGIAGLGFVLLRNYNHRKREFALMLATGFSFKKIRRDILSGQLLILFAGITTGVLPAITATLPSITGNQDIPWVSLTIMISVISLTGLMAIIFSVRSISGDSLIMALKKE